MAVKEIWRSIPGYKGYQASNLGNIRSVDRFLPDGRWRNGQMLAQYMSAGYLTTSTGHRRPQRVHVLVSLAFRGPPPAGFEVRHWDGDHHNNKLSNLVYGTRAQNEADKVRHGRSNRGGQRSGSAILTEADVRFIRKSQMRTKDLAAKFGVCVPAICNVRSRKTWAWVTDDVEDSSEPSESSGVGGRNRR